MYKFQDWQQHWQTSDTPWTGSQVNDVLFQNIRRLLSDFGLKTNSRALIPLAGDSPAVRFLYEQGFTVTAVEYVPEAVQNLIKRDFPEISFEQKKLGSADDITAWIAPRVTILEQDIFTFREPNEFSFIYDRAAYVALPRHLRVQFAQIEVESLAPGGLLLSQTAELLGGEWKGPPYSIQKPELDGNFQMLLEREHHFSSTAPTQARYVDAGISEIRHLTVIYQKPA